MSRLASCLTGAALAVLAAPATAAGSLPAFPGAEGMAGLPKAGGAAWCFS